MNSSERSHGLDLRYSFFRVSWRLQIAGGISGSAGLRRQRRKIPAVLIAVSLIASAATVLLLASFQQASAAAPADPVATITGIRMETQIGTVGAGAIDASATSLPVTELADVWGSISVPSSFDIYVDNERMTVTARNSCPGISCTYTVTRSVSSTTAADHLADAVVTRVWTSTPYLVNANKAFGVKVSADVGVTLTNGDESSATSGGTEWVSTSDSFVDGGCTAKLNPEVKTWTITRTTFTNPEVQVALDGNSLGAWQAASSPYKFSDTILENELIEGSNTIGIIAKARADKTVTTYSVKEYRFKNGSGTPACYPASNTSTAWSAVPESYITGTDANEVEWVTLTNFDSGSSQNEIQKILIAGLDPGVASRNEIQEIDISGFGNGDEYYITFNSTTSTLWLKNTGGSGNACPSAPTSCRALTTTNLDEVIESVTGLGTITVNSAANNGFNVTFGGSKAATDVPRIGISVKTDSGGALTGTYDTANSVDGLAAVAAEFFRLTYGGETRNFTHSSNASVTAIDAFLEEKFTTDGTDDEFTVTENSANAAIDGSETSADFRIEFTGLLTGQNVSDSAIVVACSGCTSSSISTVQDGQSGVTDSFTLTYNGSNGATFTYGSNATAAAIDTWIEGAESDADPDFTVTGADNVGPFLIRYDGFPGVNIAGPRVAQSACSGCTATVATVRDGAISSGPTVTFDVEQSTNSGTGATGNTTRVVAGFVVTRDTIAPTLNKAEFQTGGDVATQGGLALFDFESTEGVHTSVITGSSGDIRVDAFLIDEENQAASTPTFSAQIVTDSLFGNPKVGDTGKMSINDARLPVPCNAPVGEYFVKATLFDTFDLLGNRFTTGSTKDVGLLTVTSGDALTTTTGFWGVNGDGTYFELVDGFQATKNKGNKRITTSPGTLHSTALLNIAGRCTDENPSVSFAHKTDEQQRVKLNGFNAGDSFTVSLNDEEGGLVTFANLSSSTGGEAEIESALELIDPGYGEGALEVEVDDISSSGFTVTFVGSHGEFDVPDLIELTNLVGVTTSPTVEVRKGGMNTFDMTLEAPPGFHFEKTGQYFAKVVAGRLLDGVPFSYTSPRLQNPWGCPGSNALDIAQPCNSDVTSRLIAATNGVNTGTFAASNPPALNEVAGSDATVYDPASNSYDKSTGWESIAPLADERQEIVLTGLTVSSTLTITVNGVSTGSLNALNTSNSDIETALETARPGSNVTVSGVEPDVGATSRTFEILFGDGDSVIETYYEGTDIDTTVAVGVAGSAVVNELTRGHGELLRIRLDGLNYEGGSANAFDVPADWDVFARVRVRYGGDWTAGYSEIPVACQQFRVLSSSHFDRYDETNPFESATDLDTYNFRYAPGGPLISTSILDPATVGSPYSFTLAGTKGTTWTVSGLPDGLSDLNGVISGTPLITARGVHEITVTFTGTGSCGSVTKTLALSVGIVKITPDSLSDATVGETYSEQIGVTGDVDVTSIGTLVADVSDSDTSITVTESTPPPVVPFDIFIGDEQMRVTARTLDSGSNYLYTVTRGVDGTTAAAHLADAKVRYYSWSLAPGYSLPDGLNLGPDGVVSGTPAEGSEGDYMFTVQVIDSAGNGTSATVSLTINPTPP